MSASTETSSQLLRRVDLLPDRQVCSGDECRLYHCSTTHEQQTKLIHKKIFAEIIQIITLSYELTEKFF